MKDSELSGFCILDVIYGQRCGSGQKCTFSGEFVMFRAREDLNWGVWRLVAHARPLVCLLGPN